MLPHPENCLRVLAMPTAAARDVEEAPFEPFVLVRHQNAYMFLSWSRDIHVFFPDDREEERARGVHDRDVRHDPMSVVPGQRFNNAEKERMLRHRAHGVVTYACWNGTPYPCWVREQRVEAPVAAIVEIDVYAAVEGEHEVPDGVSALDGEAVAIEGGEEPGVLCADELAGEVVGPELFSCQRNSYFPIPNPILDLDKKGNVPCIRNHHASLYNSAAQPSIVREYSRLCRSDV